MQFQPPCFIYLFFFQSYSEFTAGIGCFGVTYGNSCRYYTSSQSREGGKYRLLPSFTYVLLSRPVWDYAAC